MANAGNCWCSRAIPKHLNAYAISDFAFQNDHSVCVGGVGPLRFPSVLLHPPPLAREFSASYGEMSRRSGFAAKADNHSDISPL